MLRRFASRAEKRAMEEVITRVLNAISVQVLPPAASEVSRIARSELVLAVLEELELALHWERIVGDEGLLTSWLADRNSVPALVRRLRAEAARFYDKWPSRSLHQRARRRRGWRLCVCVCVCV